jgi:hypothetical protein
VLEIGGGSGNVDCLAAAGDGDRVGAYDGARDQPFDTDGAIDGLIQAEHEHLSLLPYSPLMV